MRLFHIVEVKLSYTITKIFNDGVHQNYFQGYDIYNQTSLPTLKRSIAMSSFA